MNKQGRQVCVFATIFIDRCEMCSIINILIVDVRFVLFKHTADPHMMQRPHSSMLDVFFSMILCQEFKLVSFNDKRRNKVALCF